MSLLGTHEEILEALRRAAFIARYGTNEERCGKAFPQGPMTIVPADWKPGDPHPLVIERGPDYPVMTYMDHLMGGPKKPA